MPPMTIEERFRKAMLRAAQRSAGGAKIRSLPVLLHDDVPTFMEAPHHRDVKTSDVVVVGVPYESIRAQDPRNFVLAGYPLQETIYAKEGAFEAPDEIRRHSLHYSLAHGPGAYYPERDREFHIGEAVSICDAGNVPIDMSRPAEEILLGASDRILELIQPDRVPIILGGEDIVPYVGVRAVARQRKAKIAVIKFDQHFDLCWEPRYWAGSAWARCMEDGYLQPENLAIVGIRGLRNPTFFHEVARELGVPFWTLTDIDRRGIEACMMEAIAQVTKDVDYVYISFDTDVMDTACMPGQKYPEPAGMTAREILHALRLVIDHGPPLCGFDIDCLAPRYDPTGIGTHLAARCVLEVIASHGYRRQQARAAAAVRPARSPRAR